MTSRALNCTRLPGLSRHQNPGAECVRGTRRYRKISGWQRAVPNAPGRPRTLTEQTLERLQLTAIRQRTANTLAHGQTAMAGTWCGAGGRAPG